MGSLIKNKFTLGNFYTKNSLSEIIEEPNLKLVREGLYYWKKSDSTLLFVGLVKVNKPKRFRFNDKFQGEYFHWDSQTTQHIDSPKMQEIVNKEVEVHLFVENIQRLKLKPTIYLVWCSGLFRTRWKNIQTRSYYFSILRLSMINRH